MELCRLRNLGDLMGLPQTVDLSRLAAVARDALDEAVERREKWILGMGVTWIEG